MKLTWFSPGVKHIITAQHETQMKIIINQCRRKTIINQYMISVFLVWDSNTHKKMILGGFKHMLITLGMKVMMFQGLCNKSCWQILYSAPSLFPAHTHMHTHTHTHPHTHKRCVCVWCVCVCVGGDIVVGNRLLAVEWSWKCQLLCIQRQMEECSAIGG